MKTVWSVDDLEIVGYANVLKEGMLPSVVPPVFRLKADADRALLPPYSFNADLLCNSTEVDQQELQELAESQEITLFDAAFPACAGFELWVDQSFQWHYGPRSEAEAILDGIARDAIQHAEAALQRCDWKEAERQSSVAISANDARVEPLAIKAAIRRMQGNRAGEQLMAELAAPVLNGRLFQLLVEQYCSTAERPSRAASEGSAERRPMEKMACYRAA